MDIIFVEIAVLSSYGQTASPRQYSAAGRLQFFYFGRGVGQLNKVENMECIMDSLHRSTPQITQGSSPFDCICRYSIKNQLFRNCDKIRDPQSAANIDKFGVHVT